MSALSGTRAAYQPKPNIPGYGKRSRPKRVATHTEIHQLQQAVAALQHAMTATDEIKFLARVSDAFKLSRDIFRGRSDV